MARYTDESRERVRDAVDFGEIVGARTELKRAGVQRLQGLCPFHEERTPSFGIDPVEKVYYCFGCSAGGDVFRFVMETEGLDFGAALESLAERYNVQLERETEDPREAERRERRERLYALLERTAAYYVRVLWESPEAAFAREYLEQRGLREDALRAYRVGYAPDVYDRVLLGSQRAGYSTDELLAAGLIQTSRGSAGYIDRFRGRVTFPLTDVKGHVLGFGARAMKTDQQPKYLNTSDGEIFHKSQVVYGQDMARAAAARAGRVVLVEGYTDVIALHQAGVPETVAQMGTALTDAQINAVAKLAPKALFCQDPDRAGQESVARGIAALRGVNADRTTRGVEFRIVRLPSKQDPADVVQHAGADAMRELLAKAVEIERFEVERALEQPDASRDDMLAMTTPLIASLPASVLREDLIQLVANRLGIRPEVIMEVVRGASAAPAPSWNGGERPWSGDRRDGKPWRGGGRDRNRPPAPPPEPVDPRAAFVRRERSEEAFLSYCIAMPEHGDARLANVDIDDYFSSPATRKAAAHIRGRLRSPNANLPQGDEDLARLVAKLTVEAHRLEATPAKLELEALQLELHRLERRISEARLSGDTSGVGALAAERERVRDEFRHKFS